MEGKTPQDPQDNASSHEPRVAELCARFPNLVVLEQTPQLLALHTIIRDRTTDRNDFVFYSDRLIRILVEEALSTLNYKDKVIHTSSGNQFQGCEFAEKLCGVSILRAGESMETALRAVAKSVRIGKILIQREESSNDKAARLYYAKLPPDVGQRKVLLLDPMLASGGSALCAINVLKDAGVPEENITFINLISVPEGIQRVFQQCPRISIITTMIDETLNQHKYIVPGIGDFGDRYFGTY